MDELMGGLFFVFILIGVITVIITTKTSTVAKKNGVLTFVQYAYTHSRYGTSVEAVYNLDGMTVSKYLGSVGDLTEDERDSIKNQKEILTDYVMEYRQNFFYRTPFIVSIYIQELDYLYYVKDRYLNN